MLLTDSYATMTLSLESIMVSKLFEDFKEIFTRWNIKKIDIHTHDTIIGIKERERYSFY